MSAAEIAAAMPVVGPSATGSKRSGTPSSNKGDPTTENSGSHVRPIDIVVAVYQYKVSSQIGASNVKLSFQPGDTIYVLNKASSGWWDGFTIDETNPNKVMRGWFPQTYVRPMKDLFSHSKKTGNHSSASNKGSRRASYTPGDTAAPSSLAPSIASPNTSASGGFLGVPPPLTSASTSISFGKSRSVKSRKNSLNMSFPNKTVPLSINNNQEPNTEASSTVSTGGPLDPLQSATPIDSGNNAIPSPAPSPMATNESGIAPQPVPVPSRRSKLSLRHHSNGSVASGSPTSKVFAEEVTVLSIEEVEMLMNSLHKPTISTWSPVPIETKGVIGEKLIYYNKELNVYCSELPLVSMTNADTNIAMNTTNADSTASFGFPNNDHLVNLNTRRVSENPQRQTVNTVNDKNKSSVPTSLGSNIAGVEFKDSNSRKKSSVSTENEDPLSRASRSNTDLRQIQTQPVLRQAILAKNDLFYHHSKDIKTWLELEDLTLHFAKMAHKMFLKIDRFNFFKFFNMMSNLAIFTQISCRLIQQEIKIKMCNRDVKRILKSLISSLSKISINSMIYFDSSSHLQVHSTPVPSEPNALMPTKYMTNKHSNDNEYNMDRSLDASAKSKSVSTDTPMSSDRNTSTSTTDTLIPSRITSDARDLYDISHDRSSRGEFRNVSSSSNREDVTGTSRLSYDSNINAGKDATGERVNKIPKIKPGLSSNVEEMDHDSKLSLRIIFENIDQEFARFMKNIHLLHHLLQKSVLLSESHILPQFLPRFFKGSFNGGSWTNPFAAFIYSADNSLTNSNSVSGGSSAVSSSLSIFNKGNANSLSNAALSKVNMAVPDGSGSTIDGKKASVSESQNSIGLKMPPKMANAIALASGLPMSDQNITSGNTSTSNSTTDLTSSLTLSANRKNPVTGKNASKAKISKRKTKYPLSSETYSTMRRITTSVCDKLSLNFSTDAIDFLNQPKSDARNLELNSRTYEQLNENTQLIDILENLDLTIFINLKRLIKCPPKVLDIESEEFLRHAMSSISTIITEFYDVKQAFHDVLIRLIMTTQQTTLDDPYIFSSMRSNHKIDFNEPKLLERITLNKNMKKIEKQSVRLYKHLVDQDVEFNGIDFLNTSEEFVDACEAYINCANAACLVVEQLIEERENLLNYAARMMKNNLTTELLKGEQDKWFEYTSELNSDDDDEEVFFAGEQGNKDDSMLGTTSVEGDVDVDKISVDDESTTPLEDQNIPWFLQSDHIHSLVYDSKGKLRGGTKEALIEHLTNHEMIDPSFNVALLITFRSIFTTKEFFYALIYRYNLYPPEGLGFDEYNIWIEKKLNPIKCRVINIMKIFLQQYWNPQYYEDGLTSVENFVRYAISENIPGSDDLLVKVKEVLVDPQSVENLNRPPKTPGGSSVSSSFTSSKNSSMSIANKMSLAPSRTTLFRLKKQKLLDLDPFNYATQLTILEHDLYSRITLFECLDRVWGKKYCDMGGSKNITNFITNANTLTNFVSSTIVKHSDIKRRCKYIQFFLQVAEHCNGLNNFSSMTAIVSALYSSPIYRLKKTWELIPVADRDVLKKLHSLMDSKKNFIKYRGLLRSVKDVACVPFFGVYLSDLTFTNAGNPDYLHGSKDLINFSKRSKIVDIIEEILSYKKVHYRLKRIDEIQQIIEGSVESVPHIEEQYRLSLQMEPRTNSNGASGHGHAKNPLELDADMK